MREGDIDVLFLCSGNYYRSRFAELVFNHCACVARTALLADSAGLLEGCESLNPGALSPHAIAGLQLRGIPIPTRSRPPRDVAPRDFETARCIIALNEVEHRPIVQKRFPRYGGRIVYWCIADVYESPPGQALELIAQGVYRLIDELREL